MTETYSEVEIKTKNLKEKYKESKNCVENSDKIDDTDKETKPPINVEATPKLGKVKIVVGDTEFKVVTVDETNRTLTNDKEIKLPTAPTDIEITKKLDEVNISTADKEAATKKLYVDDFSYFYYNHYLPARRDLEPMSLEKNQYTPSQSSKNLQKPASQDYPTSQEYSSNQGYPPPQGYSPPQEYSTSPGIAPSPSPSKQKLQKKRKSDVSENTTQGEVEEHVEEEEEDRNFFVRRVFETLLVMILVTLIFVACAYYTEYFFEKFQTSGGVIAFFVALVMQFVITGAILCTKNAREQPWISFINCLCVLCRSVILGCIAVHYAPNIIIGTSIATIANTACCVILAYTKFDFTRPILLVFTILLTAVVMAIFLCVMKSIHNWKTDRVRFTLGIALAVFLNLLIILEFQMILRGKEVQLDADEDCLCAWMLYNPMVALCFALLKWFRPEE